MKSSITSSIHSAIGSRSECVKVVVRCRPLSDKEKSNNESKVVDVNCERGTIQLSKANQNSDVKIYTFDSVYDGDSNQEDVYDDVCHSVVESVLNGFNGTIFAYGQTGTGKTHTMEGVPDDPGVIPRSFVHIFDHISRSSHKQFLVRSSYLEIYQEEIRDLLSSNINKRLELHERSDIGVYVKDLSSFVCKNVNEIERVLAKGRHNRAVGATNMNEHSSRSHAIFMVTVEHSEKDHLTGAENIRVGKLNLVDLAGSERQIKTKTVGQRQKEAIKINLSLSALGNVISALVDGRSTHIPYRDSKLTRLLQDSLGGNARTVMIANIGPAAYNYEETLITLRYANRAKNIKNKPRVNENPKDTLLKEFQAEIERLRLQLEEKRKHKKANLVSNPEQQIDVEAAEKLQAKIKAMESKMLVGGKDILDHTNEQQQQLQQRMAELREQRQRERVMLRQLEEHEEATQEVRETFSSLQQEVEMKRRKLRKVVKEFQSINSEIRDLHETYSEDRRELERISSDLIRDLKLRYLIIDNFIPEHEKTRFLRKIFYDENEQEWRMKSELINETSQQDMDLSSRPCTATSLYSSRPCSSYSDRQTPGTFLPSTNNDDICSQKLLMSFNVPFHHNKIDELGLYMPEQTTTNYLQDIDTTHDEDEDDNIQIEIYDLAETSDNNNRSKTAISPSRHHRQNNHHSNHELTSSMSSGMIWNPNNIGKTPPPSRMRRSLTVMDNYIINDDDDEDQWLSGNQIGSSDQINNINSFFDQKRANTRMQLYHSNHQKEKLNLNQRPDTAFPRSRGLVPK